VSTMELDNGFTLPRVQSAPASAGDAEGELVARAKSDPTAFGQLFERYYPRILGFTYRCTLSMAVAEDLTSATFLKALRSLRRYDHRAKFSAWLYRIAANEVRLHWRGQTRGRQLLCRTADQGDAERVYFEESGLEAGESRQEKLRLFASLRAAVSQLPDRYRTVIALRYFEELSYDAIAEVLGKRVGTVKSLAHRGLHRLKKVLEQDAMLRQTN
jgi:RNA polymerase sigma-70 factor, ECF subfamily